jgi:hypothetical protein
MAKEMFEMECYCPSCDKDTNHKMESAGHERDGSGDKETCLECGSWKSGMSSSWFDAKLDKWIDK